MRTDPIEKTKEYRQIQEELEKAIIEKIGKGGYMGYCHIYWITKKRILREKYNMDWKSPAELNPRVLFD